MKMKRISSKTLGGILVLLMCASIGKAYYLMLPDVPPTPALPYCADADHYRGAACVQMALNSCPVVTERHDHDQAYIYNSILAHNTEPTTWFSDPNGIKGALNDPALPGCGSWVDFSNTNKNTVLNKMLYYMKIYRYLAPVSITDSEYWVTVFGYQTDVEPSYSGTVNLLNIFYYDPNPAGCPGTGIVSGTAWKNDASYWGVPHNKPGSAWHNEYIAVIEPPPQVPIFVVSEWVIHGPILLLDEIEEYFYGWLDTIRIQGIAQGPFAALSGDIEIESPILIKTPKYSYYLVPFKEHHMAAVFNAYNGSFEEFRYFHQPQTYIANPEVITSKLHDAVRVYDAEIVEMSTPELLYDTKLAQTGRFSPTWKVQRIKVKDRYGKIHEDSASLNTGGEVVLGLEQIMVPEPVPLKRPKRFSFSIHGGVALPIDTLATDFDMGWNILADVGYRFKPRWSVVSFAGYNSFRSKTAGVNDDYWLNFSANVKYSQPLTDFLSPYVCAGPGYYMSGSGNSGFGANIGVGVDYLFKPWLTIEAGTDYHRLLNQNVQFLHSHVGLIFRF